jgi:hypothetical protein
MRFTKNRQEQGQALILIVLGIAAIISMTGLAIDGAHAFSDRQQAQNTADSAALAAALAYVSSQNMNDAVYYRARSNGYLNDGVHSLVEIEHPPAQGAYSCDSRPLDCQNFIQVKITSHVQTWFASILGVKTMSNTVSAIARARKTITEPLYDGAALVALSPTICKSFYFSGSSTTTITGAGVFVNSSCSNPDPKNPQQAFYSGGAGHAQVPWVKVVGGAYYSPQDLTLEEPLATGVMPYPDIRDVYNLPGIVCGSGGSVDSTDSTVAWPGAYDSFPPDGVTEMMPGKYCVGNLKIKSNLVGEDVVIVTTGAVRINANAYVSLKAKTQGPYAGLLIYMPPAHVQPISIEGNSALELTGTILAPSSDITITGTGKKDRVNSQIIGNTISISGDNNMLFNYHVEDNYYATTPPQVELVR